MFRLLQALVVVLPSMAPLGLAAQPLDWPNKPVRFITAFAAGGSSDIMARIVAGELTNALEIGRAHV